MAMATLDQRHPAIRRRATTFRCSKPDAAFLAANRTRPTLTWIGHATFLLQLGGVNVLTDPHLSERASPLSSPVPGATLHRVSTSRTCRTWTSWSISHNHYDHLDREP